MGIRIILLVFFISSCNVEHGDWRENIEFFPPFVSERTNKELDTTNKKELEDALRHYKAIIQERIEATEETVNLHRLLAKKYNELGMYKLSLEHYEAVLEIEPANHIVLNSAGIAAGQTALSRPTLAEKQEYLRRAQRYYEYAIKLDFSYREPYLGLAVLHIFEFEDILSAKSVLNTALDIFPSDIRLLFLQARVAVLENRVDDAIALYDIIIEKSTVETEKKAAIINQKELLGSY